MQLSSNSHTLPVIRAAADSSHYLVGIVNDKNKLVGLHQCGAVVVGSIDEAKAYLRGFHYFSAFVELPVNKMQVGHLSSKSCRRQRILC